MKIALCLHGLVGTDDKYGVGSKSINYKIGLNHFKKHVFDVNDEVDVYFHTWSKDYEDRLVKSYKPIAYLAEEQPNFSQHPREQAIYCRWKSAKESLQLVKDSDQKYDFILLTRFDIAFLVDFNFTCFDKSKFYAQGPPGPQKNGLELINDLWFFSNPEDMLKLSSLYDKLNTPQYTVHIDSNHELVRKHLIEMSLEEKIEYIFERKWNGINGKLTTETPLVRWHYLGKV